MVASKLSQILQLKPTNELVFNGPFDKVVTSFLELKNPSEQRVCFKVKTTAPRRYCVRPNSGIVEPDGKIRIAIMLQPMDAESYSERVKHKFMVQSTIVRPEDESSTFDDVWAKATPDQIMDSKLKCTFWDTEDQPIETSTTDSVVGSLKTQATAVKQPSGDAPLQQSKRSSDGVTTSTPISSRGTTSTPATSAFTDSDQTQATTKFTSIRRFDSHADKSMVSSHNLTSSFQQSMNDDKKIMLVSLIMLILGVILGKYII